MDIKVAQQVLALNRQIAGIRSAFKRGDITDAERDVLIESINAKITAIRSQGSLDLSAKRK